MNPSKLAEEIERLIVEAMDSYAVGVEAIEGRVANRLTLILKNLETDSEGYILQSAANRRVLYDAENLVYEILPGREFTSLVQEAIQVIPAVDNINIRYFESVNDKFAANRAFIKNLQTSTIKNIESTILQDGLQSQVKTPLVNILNQNVNMGGQFSGMLKQTREFIEGNDEVEGRVMSYSRTFLRDSLFNYSRSYQESVTSDLGLDWYLYAGGLIDKSREFCVERAGKYFHRSEIEAWASLDWQGKKAGTTESSIFIYCGGWSCAHSLIPVHESVVPKEDLSRMG